MKHHYTMGGCRAEYDTATRTFTRWDRDDATVAESRPMTEQERRQLETPLLPDKVASLEAAVDQLILDALMGA